MQARQNFKSFALFIIPIFIGILMPCFSQAQWTGPTGSVLSTNNYVNISGVLVTGLPGATIPPYFKVQSTNGTFVTTPFAVNHNSVDLTNSSLNITSGEINVKRTSGVSGFRVQNAGALTINTNGVASPLLGLFINSDNRNFFTITEEQILFKDATQDLFKVNASGEIFARKAVVTLTNPYPDYVFEKDYHLFSINELDLYIQKHKHLPNVPSLAQVEANNKQIDIGEMQVKLLEKVEELTLYIIAQQKQIDAMKLQLENK